MSAQIMKMDPTAIAPTWQWGASADAWRLAEQLAKSQLVPDALRGKPADIALVLGTGAALGVDPFLALRSIHVVKGRPIMAADLMAALVRRSGGRLETQASATSCTVTGRRGEEVYTATWTMDDAKRAGLAGRDTWNAYPRQMLRARAVAEVCRALWPDVLAGCYVPDEAAEVEWRERVAPVAPSSPAPVEVVPVVEVVPTPTPAEPVAGKLTPDETKAAVLEAATPVAAELGVPVEAITAQMRAEAKRARVRDYTVDRIAELAQAVRRRTAAAEWRRGTREDGKRVWARTRGGRLAVEDDGMTICRYRLEDQKEYRYNDVRIDEDERDLAIRRASDPIAMVASLLSVDQMTVQVAVGEWEHAHPEVRDRMAAILVVMRELGRKAAKAENVERAAEAAEQTADFDPDGLF